MSSSRCSTSYASPQHEELLDARGRGVRLPEVASPVLLRMRWARLIFFRVCPRAAMKLRAATLLLCATCASFSHAYAPTARFAAVAAASPPRAAARMGLMDWMSRLIYDKELSGSRRRPSKSDAAGSAAMSRLKVVLAHDRTGLDEITMAKIRVEIQAVVAKYVVIDEQQVQFDMQNDDKITLVTATFPLTGARALAGASGYISSSGPAIAPVAPIDDESLSA